MRATIKLISTILILTTAYNCQADATTSSAVETLSEPTRLILKREMSLIQSSVMAIIPAYASGDTDEIARIARSIQSSYILEQKLTREQHKELHKKLPAGFIQLDKKVHYYAGMIEKSATQRNYEQIGFYLSRLTESCSLCHSQYATHRFPIFTKHSDLRTPR